MKRSQIRILIVDDDMSIGKALLEAVNRAGYQGFLYNSSAKAITAATATDFHCFIVDCMLPKMNGVDLVEELQQNRESKAKVFMMSGIYKDKAFMKDAIDRTKAEAFFAKPFDLNHLLETLNKTFSKTISDGPALLALYREAALTRDDVLDVIETESTIKALHLPMLYKRLQSTDVTGELSLTSATGDQSSVNFFQGKITTVRTPDKESYFGVMAAGLGYVTPEDVTEALQDNSGKMLGAKLIDSLSLSPHAIQVIMEEQLALRLSQTVSDGAVKVSWTDKPLPLPDYSLTKERFETLLADWTRSKVQTEVIRSELDQFGNYEIEGHFHQHIQDVDTLADLISHADFVDKPDLPYLLRQLFMGNAHLKAKAQAKEDFSFLQKRMNNLLEIFKTKNYLQILGIGEKAQTLEIRKAYAELSELHHPNRLPRNAPAHIRALSEQVFAIIDKAFQTLQDDESRNRYVLSIQTHRAQEFLKHEPMFRAAILEVQNGRFEDAATRFQQLIDRKIEFKDLLSYRIWAGVKLDRHYQEITLEEIPPEERHSAPYMMAKAVFFRSRGQGAKALEAIRTALVIDPRMPAARSELESINRAMEESGNSTIIQEVTNVFFRKGKPRKGA
jgi:DNA-binding response OmpR family regulator